MLDVTAEFFVEGWRDPRSPGCAPADPEPEGSLNASLPPGQRLPVVVHANPRELAGWRNAVRAAFRATGAPEIPAGVPCAIMITFRLWPPRKVPAERLGEPATKPDLDKLERAILDALTYQKAKPRGKTGAMNPEQCYAFRDDSQVCAISSRKRYCAPGEMPGAQIVVGRLTRGFEQPLLL